MVSAASMGKFMNERGFLGPLHGTSAKTGKGCGQIREGIMQTIDWKSIPETTSPALYGRMKQEIVSLRDSALVLIRLAELKQRMEMTLRGENFELAELEAVVSLLVGPGMPQRRDSGGFILLRPEVLSRYAPPWCGRCGNIRRSWVASVRTNCWPEIWIARISNACRAMTRRRCCTPCRRHSPAGRGVVLAFGSCVLLQPERINGFAILRAVFYSH